MTFREKRKLSRRIERGLNQLYQAHKRARKMAKKLLAAYQTAMEIVDDLQEQRLLLIEARMALWKEEI